MLKSFRKQIAHNSVLLLNRLELSGVSLSPLCLSQNVTGDPLGSSQSLFYVSAVNFKVDCFVEFITFI